MERTPRPDDKSKTLHRGTRYKEKFQSLREKYDQVNALHQEYERDLEMANARMKILQAENDLLLDAMNLAVPTQPELLQYMRSSLSNGNGLRQVQTNGQRLS